MSASSSVQHLTNLLTYHSGMNISWVAESGLADNIYRMVKEYKQTRNLLPLRVFLTGPPAAGKTTVVKQLCEHYKVKHFNGVFLASRMRNYICHFLARRMSDNFVSPILKYRNSKIINHHHLSQPSDHNGHDSGPSSKCPLLNRLFFLGRKEASLLAPRINQKDAHFTKTEKMLVTFLGQNQ